MLEWLTFVVALLAAVGSVVGPIVAYRATVRTLQAEQQLQVDRQRQETVDRLIEQATGVNQTLSTYALEQLTYLLDAGRLSIEQTTAARNAIRAVVDPLRPEVGSAPVVMDDGSAGA